MHLDPWAVLLLEVIGATLYLMNKVYLDLMERSANLRLPRWVPGGYVEGYWHYREKAWDVYLVGSLFVVVFLLNLENQAFILASIELGGIPAMLVGSIRARRHDRAPKWLNWFMVLGVLWGTAWSFYAFGGFRTWSQIFELGGSLGFLWGLYLLVQKKEDPRGYFGFMLMNFATGLLFIAQARWLFAAQQLASIVFVYEAYRIKMGRQPFLPFLGRFTKGSPIP